MHLTRPPRLPPLECSFKMAKLTINNTLTTP
jgi:hypothetical protein